MSIDSISQVQNNYPIQANAQMQSTQIQPYIPMQTNAQALTAQTNNPQTNNVMQSLYNQVTNGVSYEDDIMMPQYLKLNPQYQNQQFPNAAQDYAGNNPVFTSNPQQTQYPQLEQDDIAQAVQGRLIQENNKKQSVTKNGNPYEKTNFGKWLFGLSGLAAPTAGKLFELSTGKPLKGLFKMKHHTISSLVLATAGLLIGTLADGCANARKAKVADQAAEIVQAQQNNPQHIDTAA